MPFTLAPSACFYRRARPRARGRRRAPRVPRSGIGCLGPFPRLTNSQPAGQELKRVLTVTRGDTITFSALGQWKQNAAGGTGTTPYVLLGAAAGVNAFSQRGPEGQVTYGTNNPNWLSLLAAGLGFTIGQGAPAALGASSLEGWLKYRVLDAQGKPMLDAQGKPLAGVDYLLGTGKWEYLQTGVRIPQDGTIELVAGTSGTGEAVYFDNLRVEQTGSLIVQEQHQYAFGAPLPGLSYTIGTRRYRYGYQGQFAERDAETGFESFELRLYNSRVGKWLSTDPEGQYASPYVGMGNNPVSGVDPNGGFCEGCLNATLGEVVVTGHRATGAFARIGLRVAATALRAADAYGRYGVGVWKGIGAGLYDTGSWTVGLLPGTERHSWKETGKGLSNLATLGNLYTADGMIMRAQLAIATINYVQNMPNMSAGEIGYNVGYAGEKIGESIVLGCTDNYRSHNRAETKCTIPKKLLAVLS